MSQATTISVNDGKSTPVAHSFTPVQNKGGDGFTYVDNLVGIPTYEIKIWAKLKPATLTSSSASKLGVIQPVVVVTNGVTVQDHVNQSRVEFDFAPNATTAERNDLYALTINALQQAQLREQTRDLIALY